MSAGSPWLQRRQHRSPRANCWRAEQPSLDEGQWSHWSAPSANGSRGVIVVLLVGRHGRGDRGRRGRRARGDLDRHEPHPHRGVREVLCRTGSRVCLRASAVRRTRWRGHRTTCTPRRRRWRGWWWSWVHPSLLCPYSLVLPGQVSGPAVRGRPDVAGDPYLRAAHLARHGEVQLVNGHGVALRTGRGGRCI